jgi:hypothetical protein
VAIAELCRDELKRGANGHHSGPKAA